MYVRGAKPALAPTAETVLPAQNNNVQPPADPAPKPSPAAGSTINLDNKKLQGTFSSGENQPDGSPIAVVEVDFDGSKFSPSPMDIKVNDWVFFKNLSTVDFWPASNPHPTHTDYPGFDAKQPIAPGGQYKFQFTKAGHWGFHNHLSPSIGGVVNVTQ